MKFLYKTLCLLCLQALCEPVSAQLPELDWHKTFTPAEPGARLVIGGIQTGLDGNMVVYGQLTGSMDMDLGPGSMVLHPADGNAVLAKYDQHGNLIWAKSLPTSIHSWNLNPETGWIAYNATFYGSLDFDPGPGSHLLDGDPGSMALVQLDADGNFRGANDIKLRTQVNAIAIDRQGRVILGGIIIDPTDFDPSAGERMVKPIRGNDGFVALYDNSLRIQDAFAVGGRYDDGISSISLTADGFIAGGGFMREANFDPAGNGTNLTASADAGFIAAYSLDAGGISLKNAVRMGAVVDEVIADPQSNRLTIVGLIGSRMDADPGPGVTTLISPGRNDLFVSHTKADGSFGFGKAVSIGTSRPNARTSTSPFGGVFYGGNVYQPINVNVGQPGGAITPAGSSDLFISKFKDDGTFRYGFNIGFPGTNTSTELAVASNGAILLAGMTTGALDMDPGSGSALLNPNAENVAFLARYKDENTLGIAPQTAGGPIRIYSSGRTAFVDFSNCRTVDASITLSDLSGRSVLHTSHRSTDLRRLELADIAPGFYLLTVRDGASVTTKKIPVI